MTPIPPDIEKAVEEIAILSLKAYWTEQYLRSPSGNDLVIHSTHAILSSDLLCELMKDKQRLSVIRKFGVVSNSGNSPSESPDHPYRIQVHGKMESGSHFSSTAYGKTINEVCDRALEIIQTFEGRAAMSPDSGKQKNKIQ